MKSLFLLLLLCLSTAATAAPSMNELGKLDVRTLDNKSLRLEQLLDGKPVYLKFWATWCHECMEQMPHFEEIQKKYGKDLQVIGINLGINDEVAAVRTVQQRFNLSMPLVIDESGKLAKALEVVATPYSILLDDRGQIVHTGYEASDSLDQLIAFLAKHKTYTAEPKSGLNDATSGILAEAESDQPTALFFFATWCDWYLAEKRPAMSKACTSAQQTLNDLARTYPQYQWVGVASRMWTSRKELGEYRDKYAVTYPMHVDASNETYLKFSVKQVPTLVILENGGEVLRVDSFTDSAKAKSTVVDFMSNRVGPQKTL